MNNTVDYWDQFEDDNSDQEVSENIQLSIGTPPMKTQDMFDEEQRDYWDQFEDDSIDDQSEDVAVVPEDQESDLKKAGRYLLQIPAGIAQTFTWPLGMIKNAASAYAFDEMRKMEIEDPESLNKEAYLKSVEKVASYFPDQEMAEEFLESKGVPIQPKNTEQQLLRLGATAATLHPGNLISRVGAGTVAGGTSAALRGVGVPDQVADAAGLLAYPGGKALTEFTKSKLPGNRAKSLSSSLIEGDSLPRSTYETAEKHLNELTSIEAQDLAAQEAKRLKSPLPRQIQTQSQNPLDKTRIKETGKDSGLRPSPLKVNSSLSDEVGNIVSPQKFYNTTEGGKAIMNEVREVDQMVYRKVKKLYDISREANKGIENIHPKLVSEIDDRLSELTKIPQPSAPQTKLISTLKKIKKNLVELDEDGSIIGYKPISNQTLIDQNQALKQIIDFDFSHGDANNIFRPLIEDITNSITSSAIDSGNKAAIQSLQEANNGYRIWAETFNNDYVRPLRNITNKDYSSQFKKIIDLDELNVLRNVLRQTDKGKTLEKGLTREVVDKHLGKYLENPKSVNPKDFDKSLRELEAVLNKDEVSSIKNSFYNARKSSPSIKAKSLTNAEKTMAKYIGKDPEYIQSKFDTRSGIREMREASKTEEAKKTFHTLGRQKMRSILHEGNIEKNFTGDDLYRVLNNEKNAEIFRELIGEEATEAARISAKELGKKQMKIDKIKEGTKKAATIKFLSKILPLII